MADIVSADGIHILPWIKTGDQHKDRHSTLNWPNQAKPPPKDWKIWAQVLSHLETRGKLSHPLGRWTGTSHQTWHGYVDSSLHYYEQSSHKTWLVFKPFFKPSSTVTRASTKVWYDMASPMATTPPESLRPATNISTTARLGESFTSHTVLQHLSPNPSQKKHTTSSPIRSIHVSLVH